MPLQTRYPSSSSHSLAGSSATLGAGSGSGKGHTSKSRHPLPARPGANASGHAGAGVQSAADKGKSKEDVEIERFDPPEWRTVLNQRADLGYPDYYPSRPGFHQLEDVLTEDNVKNGFSSKTASNVRTNHVESFSMRSAIFPHMMSGCPEMLMALGQAVVEKRDELMPRFGDRIFRIPVRVTYNDSKRLQFLNDLANPKVPLHRLMRNPVPHGFKGTDIFESMFSPMTGSASNASHNRTPSASGRATVDPIPLDRALWFIRSLGSNEITAHRSRAQPVAPPVSAPSPAGATPSSTNTASSTPTLPLLSNDWYTQEFTNLFTAWLRIQLVQLALPARSSLKANGPAKAGSGILGDEKARARWSAKWDYSISLLHELHSRRLISCRVFTGWLADNLATANLSQLMFVALLSAQYISAFARHVSHGRLWVRAALERIKDIRTATPPVQVLKRSESLLISVITALFDADPLVLLSPVAWRTNAELISEVILSSSSNEKTGARRAQQLADVKRRSEALGFRPVTTESTTSPRRQQMEEIHKLDSICADTNMAELCNSFFDGPSSSTSANVDIGRLEEKVFILLNWAMGLFQLGGHRPYASHTLIKLWLEQFEQHQSKSHNPQTLDFFPLLYKWLDESHAAQKSENVLAVGITFGEFIRQGVFSYSRYLQTLIAKGHTARSRDPRAHPSHHLGLLRTMPIFVQAKDLLQQRRFALSGDDPEIRQRDDMEETQALCAFKEEVREYVPEIFGWKRYGRSAALRDRVNHQMATAATLNRYLFLQARFWMFPAVADKLAEHGKGAMDASTFVRVMHVFRLCCAFSTIADLLIKALRTSDDEEILLVITDAIQRDGDAWTAIDRWSQMADALICRHRQLVKRQKHVPAFSDLLLHLCRAGRIDEQSGAEVRKAVKRFKKARGDKEQGPDLTQAMTSNIIAAIRSGDLGRATTLGREITALNRSLDSWGLTWWRTIIEALCCDVAPPVAQQDVLLAALAMVGVIDDACPLVSMVTKWLDSLPFTDITEMFGQHFSMLPVTFFLHLVAQRRLPSLPVVKKIVFPVWRAVAATIIGNRAGLQGKQALAVESSVILAQQLLLDQPPHAILPPTTLCQAHIVQTARTRILHADHVPELIRHLPFLVVFGATPGVAQRTRHEVSDLLQSLAMLPEFKTAAFRQLDLLKDAFLSSDWSKPGIEPTVETGMVETLKLIMSDGSIGSSKPLPSISSSLNATARFSAWRWTRVVLEMRVEFKRLAMRIDHGEDAAGSRHMLNQLVRITLDREISADDADLLCEAFRGIEPVAAQEILAVGLERLATLLGPIIEAEQQSQLEPLARSLDLMLRILSSGRDDKPAHVDQATLAARHRLIDLLSVALQAVERLVTADSEMALPDGIAPPQPGEVLSVILKVLKFVLSMPVMEQPGPAAPRPDFARLAASYFRVLTSLAGHGNIDIPEWFTDMLIHVIDAAPPQARGSLHPTLAAEASTSTAQTAFAKNVSLLAALPHSSPPRRQMTLSGTRTGDDDNSDFALQLDDRSWELFEQMAPETRELRHRDLFLASKPLKDTSSMPMALFNPRLIRDCLPQSASPSVPVETDDGEMEIEPELELDEGYLDYASERNLGDGVAGEPLAVKQMMTHLYAVSDEAEVESEIEVYSKLDAESPAASISAVSASASASTVRSRRASNRLAAGARPGQIQTQGSNRDPITVGDDEDDEDDGASDLEIVDAPVAKRPRVGSRSSGNGNGTGTGTGTGGGGGGGGGGAKSAGKAPPRKTTGGKAPAKRTTGGKSLRGNVGSKAPRAGVGRRRSGAE